MSQLRISRQHGVNPSLEVCQLCGEETGSILFLGQLPRDARAPRHVPYGLCQKCEGLRRTHVAMFPCTARGVRDGKLIWVRREVFASIFRGEAAEGALKVGVCECDEAMAAELERMSREAEGLDNNGSGV